MIHLVQSLSISSQNNDEMKKTICFWFPVFSLIVGCGNSNHSPFSYTFTLESMDNYKIEFELHPDSTYKIYKANYFFDRVDRNKEPLNKSGKLSEEEFKSIETLINKNIIEKMNDSYGFDSPDIERDIIYTIQLTRNNRSNFVSVNGSANQTFPKDFTDLISHTMSLVNEKIDNAD